MSEMKNCPFCGEKSFEFINENGTSRTWEGCTNCGARGPVANTLADAVIGWNKRHGVSQAQPSAWEQLSGHDKVMAKYRWQNLDDEIRPWNDTTRESIATEILAERKEVVREEAQKPNKYDEWRDALENLEGRPTTINTLSLIDIAESLAKLAGR